MGASGPKDLDLGWGADCTRCKTGVVREWLEQVRLVHRLIDMLTPQNLILAYVPSSKTNATFEEGSQVFEDKNMKLKYAPWLCWLSQAGFSGYR